SCFAEASTTNVAVATSAMPRPVGHGSRYSKYPEPAPSTFSPSSTFHCLTDHFASANEAAGVRTTRARRPSSSVTSSGAVPSTTNVVKLRRRTAPAWSVSATASTATPGSFGMGTDSGSSASDIQGRYGTARCVVNVVRSRPSVSQSRSHACRTSPPPYAVLAVRNEAHSGTHTLSPALTARLRAAGAPTATYHGDCPAPTPP